MVVASTAASSPASSTGVTRTAESTALLRSGPSVAIFEPNDIVEFGCARLQHDSVFERSHPMSCARQKVDRLTRQQFEGLQIVLGRAHLELEAPGLHRDRLLLLLVVLQ